MKKIFYHVVTGRPLNVGDEIIFDEKHHSGVYDRVYQYKEIVDDIYAHPEKYQNQEFDHHLKVAIRELAMEEVRKNKYPDYPSRLNSLYVSRTLEESEMWFNTFINLGRTTY